MLFNRFMALSSLLAATTSAAPFVPEDFPLAVVPLSELPPPDTIPAPVVNVSEPIKLVGRATEGIHFVNCQGNGYAYSIEIVSVFLFLCLSLKPDIRTKPANLNNPRVVLQ
jgi:hypothetical protein